MKTGNAALWLIDRHVERGNGDAIAIRCRQRDVTYGELMRSTWRVQNALRQLGVRSGERILILANDGPDMVSWMLGCLRSAVVAVPVPTDLAGDRVGDIARETEACLLVVSASFRFLIDAAVRRTPRLFQAVIVDGPGRVATSTIGGPTVVSWSDFSDDSESPSWATTEESPALWFCRHDSTGRLVRVASDHGRMQSTYERYGRVVDRLSSADRVLGLEKLYLPSGLVWAFGVSLGAGATMILEPGRSASPRGVCELIASEGATVFFADSETALRMIEGDIDAVALRSIRTTVLGDEADGSVLVQRFSDRFGHVAIGTAT